MMFMEGVLLCYMPGSFCLSFDVRSAQLGGGFINPENALINWRSPDDLILNWISSIGFGAEDSVLIVTMEGESGM